MYVENKSQQVLVHLTVTLIPSEPSSLWLDGFCYFSQTQLSFHITWGLSFYLFLVPWRFSCRLWKHKSCFTLNPFLSPLCHFISLSQSDKIYPTSLKTLLDVSLDLGLFLFLPSVHHQSFIPTWKSLLPALMLPPSLTHPFRAAWLMDQFE